jgi:ATP-dependent Clp protease adapter protein ClpS
MVGIACIAWSGSTETPPRAQSVAPAPRLARQVSRPVSPLPLPEGDERSRPRESARYAVRVMDNPVNTYEEVVTVCALVLEVSLDEGFRIAYTVDHEGSCVVGAWPRAKAEKIAQGIAVIGIEVRLEPLDD